MKDSILEKAAKIKCVVFDIDGVFTDGKITYADDGKEIKSFYVHDGLGVKLLQKHGIHVGIITSRESPIVTERFKELGIEELHQGYRDKTVPLQQICDKHNISLSKIAYVGDDLPDLPIIQQCGLGIAVPNAIDIVKQHAAWITTRAGGQGGVREVCDMILSAQGKLDLVYDEFKAKHS